jgi:tetratricopeptide (TPR) repeat protein
MKKLIWILILTLCLSALSAAESPAVEQVDRRAEIAAALYTAAATLAAAERIADEKLHTQRREIDTLRAKVRAGERNHTEALSVAEERYVTALAERDRSYAQEIAVFRAALESITATPEGAAALARFNAGDEFGALAVLDDLRAARDAARRKRMDIESAAEGRNIALLALEARNKGKTTTAQVIERFEEITRLDPGVHWDWVELGRLYVDAGRLDNALRAAQAAANSASNDRDRSVALDSLGDVQSAQGDLSAALKSFQDSLAIRDRLARADPGNAAWQRDLSVSFNKIGDVQSAQGDLSAALKSFQDSLAIADRLARADPGNAAWQRDLIISNVKLSAVTGDKSYLEKAFAVALDMQRRNSLAPRDAWMIDELRRLLAQ